MVQAYLRKHDKKVIPAQPANQDSSCIEPNDNDHR